jgi:hypothetical protein
MKSTTNINMEGTEVNSEILRALKNIKQGSILDSSYFRVQHTFTDDYNKNIDHDYFKEITKKEMINKLSLELLEKYKDSFEENRVPSGTEFSLSMLAMSTTELKHIVEYCIRTMPQVAIEEIRK